MKMNFTTKTLICVMLLLLNVSVVAQVQSDSLNTGFRSPCQSRWTKYSNPTETYSIVRSNDRNHVVYIQEKQQNGFGIHHTFIVKDNQNSEASFSTYFVNSTGPFIFSVEIYDMRLFGDTCYFCGKYITPLFIGDNRIVVGFMGRFVTSEILSGTGSVYYCIVEKTTELSRLAMSKGSNSQLLISAIGNGYRTIVELKNYGALGWKMRRDSINSDDNIVFTDIMTIRDSLTLLAQYDCANDNLPSTNGYDNNHQKFLLDRFDLRGCYYTCSPSLSSCMAEYVMGSGENYYFHYARAPMRLFHINDSYNEFGVAFGVEEADGSDGGIRLFTFQHAWKYYNSLYYQTGQNAEIREIGNKYMTQVLFALSRDNVHPNGLITIPILGGGSNDVFWLANNTYTFNSLTQKLLGSHIDVSGHDGSFNFHLFDQGLYSLSLPTCFAKTDHQYVVIPEHRAEEYCVKWIFTDEKNMEWRTIDIEKIQLSSEIICEECNLEQE